MSEPSQSERELAKRIVKLIPQPTREILGNLKQEDLYKTIARLIHAENDRQREVLQKCLLLTSIAATHYQGQGGCTCGICEARKQLNQLLK